MLPIVPSSSGVTPADPEAIHIIRIRRLLSPALKSTVGTQTDKGRARERQPYPMLTSPRWAASATACVRPTALSFSKMACT
jgi:hypothetical protein